MFDMVWIFVHSPYLWPKFRFKTPGNMIAKKHNTCLMFNMVWIFAHSPYLWPEF